MKLTASGVRFRPAGTPLLSLELRFRLGSGLSLAAFDRLRGTRVVASRLPRTRNPKRTVLPAVVETSVATF